jgi:hypothetical protein
MLVLCGYYFHCSLSCLALDLSVLTEREGRAWERRSFTHCFSAWTVDLLRHVAVFFTLAKEIINIYFFITPFHEVFDCSLNFSWDMYGTGDWSIVLQISAEIDRERTELNIVKYIIKIFIAWLREHCSSILTLENKEVKHEFKVAVKKLFKRQ